MRRLQQEEQLVGADLSDEDIKNGVPVSVDVNGSPDGRTHRYRAKSHSGLIDIERVRHYEVSEYWEPVYAPKRGGLILDPADFYILASRDPVKVPPSHAAEIAGLRHAGGRVPRALRGLFRSRLRTPGCRRAKVRARCWKCAPMRCPSSSSTGRW